MCLDTAPRAGCPSVSDWKTLGQPHSWWCCCAPCIPLRSRVLLAIPHSTPQDLLPAPHIHLTTVHPRTPGATLANFPIPLQSLGLAQEALGPSSATQSGAPQHSNTLGAPASAISMDSFIRGIVTCSPHCRTEEETVWEGGSNTTKVSDGLDWAKKGLRKPWLQGLFQSFTLTS